MTVDSWTTDPGPPFEGPDLESVIDREAPGYVTPRKRSNEKLDISVRAIPADIWDIIYLLKETCPQVGTLSFAEGCLLHTGLGIVELAYKAAIPQGRGRREGIIEDDLDLRSKFHNQKYTFIHLGNITIDNATIFCLSETDRARVMEVSSKYGLSVGKVVFISMTAGIAQSTHLLPEPFRKRAESEFRRFIDWLRMY